MSGKPSHILAGNVIVPASVTPPEFGGLMPAKMAGGIDEIVARPPNGT